MGEIAQRYAVDLGFHVFPTAQDCKPGRLKWDGTSSGWIGVYDATNDPAAIDGFWRAYPDANISLATGLLSGVFVLDVDCHDGGANGFKTLDGLEREHGDMPITPYVDTPGHGRHIYFRNPDRPLRNRVNIVPGIDVRASGAAVPLPPSMKRQGPYIAPEGLSHFADAPSWLLDIIDPPQPPAPPRPPLKIFSSSRGAAYIQSALMSEAHRVRNTPPNTGRNQQLFMSSASIGGLVAGGFLPEDIAMSVLYDAAVDCGLVRDDGQNQVRATINSGFKAGRANPREVDFGPR